MSVFSPSAVLASARAKERLDDVGDLPFEEPLAVLLEAYAAADLSETGSRIGIVDTLKAVLPGMREQGSGHVINISSMTGLVANPPNVYYSCTKFALEALTEGLAKEVGPLGIKVTAVEPGAFRTDWASRSMKESGAPLEAYAADVGVRKELIKAFADHLPGDPRKVADAVLMLTTLEQPPLRLLLGHDVLKATREKLAEMTASIDEWEAVTKDVNFPA